jgi:hypothetical protein
MKNKMLYVCFNTERVFGSGASVLPSFNFLLQISKFLQIMKINHIQ